MCILYIKKISTKIVFFIVSCSLSYYVVSSFYFCPKNDKLLREKDFLEKEIKKKEQEIKYKSNNETETTNNKKQNLVYTDDVLDSFLFHFFYLSIPNLGGFIGRTIVSKFANAITIIIQINHLQEQRIAYTVNIVNNIKICFMFFYYIIVSLIISLRHKTNFFHNFFNVSTLMVYVAKKNLVRFFILVFIEFFLLNFF